MALDAWIFCGGWRPERLPMYLATQQVENVAALVDGLATIRATIDRHKAEKRKA